MRDTSQRRAIRKAFESSRRPLGPAEVLAAAQTEISGLGIATVYRNIKRMVDDGELAVVELPGEPPRYELAGKGHHHHFHCRVCDRLYEVEGCTSAIRQLTPKGFKLEGHDMLLYGACAACHRNQKRK